MTREEGFKKECCASDISELGCSRVAWIERGAPGSAGGLVGGAHQRSSSDGAEGGSGRGSAHADRSREQEWEPRPRARHAAGGGELPFVQARTVAFSWSIRAGRGGRGGGPSMMRFNCECLFLCAGGGTRSGEIGSRWSAPTTTCAARSAGGSSGRRGTGPTAATAGIWSKWCVAQADIPTIAARHTQRASARPSPRPADRLPPHRHGVRRE